MKIVAVDWGRLTCVAVEYYTSSGKMRDVVEAVRTDLVCHSLWWKGEVGCKWSLSRCVGDVHRIAAVVVSRKCCEVSQHSEQQHRELQEQNDAVPVVTSEPRTKNAEGYV